MARPPRPRRNPALLRAAVLGGAAGALVLGVAGPASAHVTVTPSTTAAGGYAVLTFSVPHGCEGSSTTGVTIAVPDEITSVTPTVNPRWEVEKQVETLDPPVTDSHGNTVAERVATVAYTTTTPLPDGYRDTFELSLQLPDTEGAALTFPVVQTCENGEEAWIEVPAAGQDPEELELPAPAFTLTAAGDGGHGAETTTAEQAADGAEDDAPTTAVSAVEQSDDGPGALLVAAIVLALGLGLAGVVLAGLALRGQRHGV